MTTKEFKTLKVNSNLRPIYNEYYDRSYEIVSINQREGIIEISEMNGFGEYRSYRYENLTIIL